MTVAESFEKAQNAIWHDEHGSVVSVTFNPGASPSEIAVVELAAGKRLPADFREILSLCSSVEGAPFEVDFKGRMGEQFAVDIMPFSVVFAEDGAGNAWCVDISNDREVESTIYYVSHDPPMVLFQCTGIATFLEELTRAGGKFRRSALFDVAEDRLFDVWSKNPGVLTNGQAHAAGSELAAFAQELDPGFLIVDLRTAKPGMGFTWGRFGPDTVCRRFGNHRIYAYAPPKKKPGLLSRLFGR